MAQANTRKRLEKLEQRADTLAGIISTLRESLDKVEKRQKEAVSMSQIKGQLYAKEWASKATHQQHNADNLKKAIEEYSNELNQVCEKIEQLERGAR